MLFSGRPLSSQSDTCTCLTETEKEENRMVCPFSLPVPYYGHSTEWKRVVLLTLTVCTRSCIYLPLVMELVGRALSKIFALAL